MHQPQLSADDIIVKLKKQCKNPHLLELEQLEQLVRNIVYQTAFGGKWQTTVDDTEGFV